MESPSAGNNGSDCVDSVWNGHDWKLMPTLQRQRGNTTIDLMYHCKWVEMTILFKTTTNPERKDSYFFREINNS